MNIPSSNTADSSDQNYQRALVVLTSLFFIWGFLTVLNDILVPHLKSLFSLNYTQAMLIQFCFFTAYFLVSLPAGRLLKYWGYRRSIVTGLLTMAMGCLFFYPAAGAPSYSFFLVALFILASGMTILQVAANPYVTVLGPAATASSRLNLAQALNALGTTLGPVFGSVLFLSVSGGSNEEKAHAVQLPYLGLAATLILIAFIFSLFKLPEVTPQESETQSKTATLGNNKRSSAWSYRHLVLAAIAIFTYVGAEVSIGSFLVSYLSESNIGNLSLEQAGHLVSYYWGGAMIGRFLGAALQKKIAPQNLLLFNTAMAATLLLTSMLSSHSLAMYSVLSIGLFNSIMFPTIFALGLKGLGRYTGQASGILCTAIVGGALVPFLQGNLADHFGIQMAFTLPLLCYLYIFYFAWKGYRPIQT